MLEYMVSLGHRWKKSDEIKELIHWKNYDVYLHIRDKNENMRYFISNEVELNLRYIYESIPLTKPKKSYCYHLLIMYNYISKEIEICYEYNYKFYLHGTIVNGIFEPKTTL